MKKNTKLLIGSLVVLVIAAILFRGQLTGKVVSCSNIPKLTYVEPIGDTISISWEETSTLKGAQMKYEISLYKQKEDGTYDFKTPDETDVVPNGYGAFNSLDRTRYIIKVRAKNPSGCPDYSGYASSEEVLVNQSYSGPETP